MRLDNIAAKLHHFRVDQTVFSNSAAVSFISLWAMRRVGTQGKAGSDPIAKTHSRGIVCRCWSLINSLDLVIVMLNEVVEKKRRKMVIV